MIWQLKSLKSLVSKVENRNLIQINLKIEMQI
jgi:hypothetical protein